MTLVFVIGTIAFAWAFYAGNDPAPNESARMFVARILLALLVGALSWGMIMAVAAGGHLDAYTDTHM